MMINLDKLKKTAAVLLIAPMLALSIATFLSVPPAHAQSKENLCTGANLSFDATKNNCKTADGTAAGAKCTNAAGTEVSCSENSLNHLISVIINVFSIIVGVVAVIMIIVGGFRYVTAGGDSGRITTAKNTLVFAIVGLVIVALAQVLVKFVLSKVT